MSNLHLLMLFDFWDSRWGQWKGYRVRECCISGTLSHVYIDIPPFPSKWVPTSELVFPRERVVPRRKDLLPSWRELRQEP